MFDWTLWFAFASCFCFGFAASWFAQRALLHRSTVRALLFILAKLHKRGVYFSPFDMAIINEAHQQVRDHGQHPRRHA